MSFKRHITQYFTSAFNWRIATAFAAGLIISSLFTDFPLLRQVIEKTQVPYNLSLILAKLTHALIYLFNYNPSLNGNAIQFTLNNGVYFAFGCLGIREIIWFTLFIIITRGQWKHKLWYIPTGVIVIEISNILRSASIAILNFHNPQSFNIIHVQGTLWFIYGTILFLWIIWLQFIGKK